MRHYYAGYNDMSTDVFVFNTRKERDVWVSGNSALSVDVGIERIDITAKEAKILAGKNFIDEPEWDDFHECYVYQNWSVA